MNQLTRPVLRPGGRVAVVSPASAASPERIQAGVAALQAHGYDPVLMPHALNRGPLYYAGTAKERALDLHSALTDPSFEAVVCTRGGWGSAELLPLLDEAGTASLLRERPRAFVGYSDHTSLHLWLAESCQLMSYYAPMAAADWSLPNGADLPSWDAVTQGLAYSFGAVDGLRVLRPGRAHGTMLGGCLAIVEASLATPWSLRITGPCILFLEDIGVKPYQWDRMLQHLRFAGLFDRVTGIVLGDMSANVEGDQLPLLEAACLHALRDFAGPVAIGLRCGHVTGANRSLVLGEEASLVCEQGATLTLSGQTGGDAIRSSRPTASA